MSTQEKREQLALFERWLVWLIAVHSIGVGVVLTFFPAWATGFGGWSDLNNFFFVRQGGIFHFVVAFGYLLEYRRHGGVTLLVVTKTMACVFLLGSVAGGETAWSVPFSGVTDGMMGLVVGLLRRTRNAAETNF